MIPRFIQVPYAEGQFTRYEVLERFNQPGSPTRQFNLRKRGGQINPEHQDIVDELATVYGIKGLVGTVLPLAGDLCVMFEPVKEKAVDREVPSGLPVGPTVSGADVGNGGGAVNSGTNLTPRRTTNRR